MEGVGRSPRGPRLSRRARQFLCLPLATGLLMLCLGTFGAACAEDESDSSESSCSDETVEDSSGSYRRSGGACSDNDVYASQNEVYYYDNGGCTHEHYNRQTGYYSSGSCVGEDVTCVSCRKPADPGGVPGPPSGREPEPPSPFPAGLAIERISQIPAGAAGGDGPSFGASLSADGRLAAFESEAGNLVAGDANGRSDVFLYDRQSGELLLVSERGGGGSGSGGSFQPALSAQGRHVAFVSWAGDLVAGDPNGAGGDVIVFDALRGSLERAAPVGVGPNGPVSDPALSADGRHVVFAAGASNLVGTDPNGKVADVFLWDRALRRMELVSTGGGMGGADGPSARPAVSAEGRYVAFESEASNLVAHDPNGKVADIFLRDRSAGTTVLVSEGLGAGGAGGPSRRPCLSADGRFVAFESAAPDLVADDPNGTVADVLVYDARLGSVELVSTGGDAPSGAPSLSGEGRFVAFESFAGNLAGSGEAGLSQVLLFDRQSGRFEMLSRSASGQPGNDHSLLPALSGDGRYAAFESFAANLVPGDGNWAQDVFAAPNPAAP